MIITSNNYKEIMSRRTRNPGHVRVTYGLNTVEESNLTTEGPNESQSLYGGFFPKLKRGQIYKAEANYAYLGVNSMRTNGSQIILPKQAHLLLDNGYVSDFSSNVQSILDGVKGYKLEYSPALSIYGDNDVVLSPTGFTLHFDLNNTYPRMIRILGVLKKGNEIELVVNKIIENNDVSFNYIEDGNIKVTSYVISFDMLNKPSTYFRLSGITLGGARIYTGKDIVSCSLTKSIDFLSNNLSYQEFNVVINNYDKHYNPIAPAGIYKEFDINHAINVEFGLELDSGDIEWVQVANLITNGRPTFNDYTYTIKANDKLTQLTKLNHFSPSTKSIRDNGMTWKEWIDKTIEYSSGYIKADDILFDEEIDLSKKASYSSPLLPMNQSLQLFANINTSVLMTNNVGKLQFKNGWIPKITIYDNGHVDHSDILSTINALSLPVFSYASLQPDYMETMEHDRQLILPRKLSEISEQIGYISEQISQAPGVFEDYPTITIEYSLPVNEKSLRLVFNNVDDEYAIDFDVEYYRDSEVLAYKHVVTNNKKFDYSSNINQKNINKILIKLKKWSKGNHRAVINKIGAGKVEDFYLNFDSIMRNPTIEVSGKVKDIVANFKIKEPVMDEKEHKKLETITYDKVGLHWYLNKDENYTIYSKIEEGKGLEKYQNAYGCLIEITETPATVEFYSIPFKKNDEIKELIAYDTKGQSYVINNPLCCCKTEAIHLADWYQDYVQKGVRISAQSRGNPEIEPFDFITIQTQYDRRVPICITKTTISFNGSFSGQIEGVRI